MFKNLKIVPFLFILTLTACNRNCECTEQACPCPELMLVIEANLDTEVSGGYSEQELNSFDMIRTDLNFLPIDSVKVEFKSVANKNGYNKIYYVFQNVFPEFKDFKSYNFLLKNRVLNTTDTLSNFSYTEKMEHVKCNSCFNCEDEFTDCLQYSNITLVLNSTVQDGFAIRVKK